MKQIKCPKCATWYSVAASDPVLSYQCTACHSPYKVETIQEKERKEGMKNPVSKPPITWKRFSDGPWPLVILNNILFILQTIVFAIATIIGILVAPL